MTATIDPLEGYFQALALFIPFEGLHNFLFHIFYLFLVLSYWALGIEMGPKRMEPKSIGNQITND